MKFTFSIFRMFFLILNFVLISFIVYSQEINLNPGNVVSIDWIQNHWSLVLLTISEILALLPGKHSGLVKILLFFFRRLTGIPAIKLNSKSKL